MGQSLVKNYTHIIFSTKFRQKFILPRVEKELHSYLGGICNDLDYQALKVGGHIDHVHILCMMSKKIPLMDFMRELKSESSKFMKKKGKEYDSFYWQGGYGSFSINPGSVDDVSAYITNQHEHHQHTTFQEEYRRILEENDVEYDDRYIWD